MNNETLAALKDSIQHWRDNVTAKTPGKASTYWTDCPLCRMFLDAKCDGCPVGHRGCMRTPYDDAADALDAWILHDGDLDCRENWRWAAQAELDFLISLLPEGETP